MAQSSCVAAGRSYVFSRFKKFLERIKVAYLMSRDDKADGPDDVARMLSRFENSDEIKFTTISDVPTSELRDVTLGPDDAPSVVMSTTKGDDGQVRNSDLSCVPGVEGLVKQTRISRKKTGKFGTINISLYP